MSNVDKGIMRDEVNLPCEVFFSAGQTSIRSDQHWTRSFRPHDLVSFCDLRSLTLAVSIARRWYDSP